VARHRIGGRSAQFLDKLRLDSVGAQGITSGGTVDLSTGSWKLISISEGSIAAATFVLQAFTGLLEGQ
jgi:hypothetical protein